MPHAGSGERTCPTPLVVFARGAVAESTHSGSVAVCDPDGRLVAYVGDAHRLTTMRSAAKPFQAMAVVETGAADRFTMSPPELAIIAGSHSGEPRHTETVRGLLSRAGLTSEVLQTGVHPPLHMPARVALERSGESPSPLHHNCSGKHCGMLCACVHRGWDVRSYIRPDHPVQRAIQQVIADMTRIPEREVGLAIDGCGVPTFAVPLVAFAMSFARIAHPDVLAPAHRAAAERVRGAMLAHPEMVGGEARFDTDAMRVGTGRLLAKAGAEASHGVAALERGWGIAVKIEDGGARAAPVVVVETLRQLGLLTGPEAEALADHARPLVRNYRGEVVGEGRPIFELS